MRETEIIDEIRIRCKRIPDKKFRVSIGDDCAVRKRINSGNLLLSADISIEDIHFSRKYMSLHEIGYKSAVSNVSDIAAMGAAADFLLVSLAFPSSFSNNEILEIYDGIIAAGIEYNVPIVGGDLSVSEKIIVSISIGGISGKRILMRSGAKAGDNIWVSGFPGMSGLGLNLLQKYGRKEAERMNREAVIAHITPKAQIKLGMYLSNEKSVHSCIDISDGIAKEIRTIAEKSAVGAEIFTPKENFEFFFCGGEDYELLFTADKSFNPIFENINFSKIGEIVRGNKIFIIENDKKRILDFSGFEHF
jgi:thiamine-monophosphate kinase